MSKFFTTEVFNKNIYVVLVDEMISRASNYQKILIKEMNAKNLKVDGKLVVLACNINNKLRYICGDEKIINELEMNKNINIT